MKTQVIKRTYLLTKRQYVNTTAATTAITINITTSDTNATTMTAITVMTKGKKVKFSRNSKGGREAFEK